MQVSENLNQFRISPVLYTRRLAALQAMLEQEKLQAFLVSHFANRRFLSGYSAPDHPPDETAGILLVTLRQAFLITNVLYATAAREEVEPAGVEVVTSLPGETYTRTIARLIQQSGARKVGFEALALIYQYHALIQRHLGGAAELVPTLGFVDNLRCIKDDEEIQALRRAVAISDRAFNEVCPLVRPGVTEKYLAWEIERRIREFGGEALAFETVVAGGPNSSTPHALPGERVLEEGDPVIIDMGARFMGYNSDMTRTLCAGEPTARFKEIYNIVLEAQLAACEVVRPGFSASEPDNVARAIINRRGFGDNFGHSVGHGIGLAVHEAPSLRQGSPHILAPGMVHSLEPGIYLPGWGGVRIEDLLLVTAGGYEILTGALKANYY